MENSANIKSGGITAKFMQRELEAAYHETMQDYEHFIGESEHDLADTVAELEQLQHELTKEQRITQSLQEEKRMNDA
jgi:hypothetical protein